MTTYVVHYIAKGWVNKPDPNGFGRCSIAFTSWDSAIDKAAKLQKKGCGNLLIEKITK